MREPSATPALDTLVREVGALAARAAHYEREFHFYRRVLIQAVLTAGGELRVDPDKADAARNIAAGRTERNLEFGNGVVCFHGERGSLWGADKP